ncbi:Phosphopantothenoylcysteine decarboxylase / Phosphopantothenoylcysteine synthetase [hydrothermal vent metagenome]|uniref:Phosphopantothenoylcysteine decarboxylase / Phosphopantothenoylcysteine synthetase n=1 Tax=hydrothermal vent metagenome TaxID=652676 RepID=A0A3B1AYC0_9ZZZZ
MQVLTNKRILLGVTGSIAAYKAADWVRRLREAGAEVRVVMTRGATEFVTPMTFQALSGNPVHRHLLDTEAEAGMGHIELARWADVILVAPASADFLARLTQGRADDLLAAVCLAAGKIPLAIAPAMNVQMWLSAATRENVRLLGSRGVLLLGPEEGEQACGEVGVGRLISVEAMMSQMVALFVPGSLTGKTVLVSAGPTREAIDPVRYLSNHSSGKMGFSIAAAAQEAGAKVILVAGPVSLSTPDRVERIDVISAMEMHDVILKQAKAADIFISTAAVADYRPALVENEKLKRNENNLSLELLPNPDIIATVKAQFPHLFCVGFAAETQNLADYAQQKLYKKGIEMVAANWVGPAAEETAGTFGSDNNALHLFWRGGELELELASKEKLARQLISAIVQFNQGQSKIVSNIHFLNNEH